MSGLFATFNIGKRGLFSQQKAIDVTTHNIANANTQGYSRQRAILETTKPFGMPSMNSAIGPGQIGTGVEVKAIQRIRDEFMDYQVRREKSTLGQYQARDKYLSEVESIFNEPSDTAMSTLIGKFFNAWEELSTKAEDSNSRTVVAQQSAALADELNHTYNQLVEVKKNAQESIKQSIFDVNGILDRVDKLNQQIMSVKISGMEPNDLLDQRDLLLDQLSEKFNITVEKDNFYSINLKPNYTSNIEGNGNIGNPYLVKRSPNDSVRRFSYIKSIEPKDGQKSGAPGTYTITYLKNGDKDKEETFTLTINNQEEFKRLDEGRVLWSQVDRNNDDNNGLAIKADGTPIKNGEIVNFKDLGLFDLKDDIYRGELKGYMSVQKDVDSYIDQLNKLAKAIAFSVNAIHSGKTDIGSAADPTKQPPDADYMPFFVNNDKAKDLYVLNGTKHILYDGVTGTTASLQSVLDGEVEITAGNISVNKQILDNVMEIKTRSSDDQYVFASQNDQSGEKDGRRALAIAKLRNTLLKIQDIKGDTTRADFVGIFTNDVSIDMSTISSDINGMKIDAYFKDTVDKLGIQEQEALRTVANQETLLQGFQERRDSISGVSIDEEMANLIQFQHAYGANAKIISTVDELLDVVVNGLKR